MGEKMWLWVGAGWHGTSGSGFEQAARRKNNRQQRTDGGERRQRRDMLPFQTKNVTLSSFFPSLPLFFSSYPSVPVAAHWYTDSIFPPLSTSAISLISLCCSGSLSFNRHNKAVLGFFLHSIPTVHPSLTQTLPTARDIQTHLLWTTLWSSYKPDWPTAKGGAFITGKIHKKIETWERKRADSREF